MISKTLVATSLHDKLENAIRLLCILWQHLHIYSTRWSLPLDIQIMLSAIGKTLDAKIAKTILQCPNTYEANGQRHHHPTVLNGLCRLSGLFNITVELRCCRDVNFCFSSVLAERTFESTCHERIEGRQTRKTMAAARYAHTPHVTHHLHQTRQHLVFLFVQKFCHNRKYVILQQIDLIFGISTCHGDTRDCWRSVHTHLILLVSGLLSGLLSVPLPVVCLCAPACPCQHRRMAIGIACGSGFLATYWVPRAIGHSMLRPDPILIESQSSLGVPLPRAFTLSLLLLVLVDNLIENLPFWQRLDCSISTPPPWENDPTPFMKKLSINTRVFMFYRVGVHEMGSAHPKKTSNNEHCLVSNNSDLYHLFMDLSLNHPNSGPTLKNWVTEQGSPETSASAQTPSLTLKQTNILCFSHTYTRKRTHTRSLTHTNT